MRYQKIFCQIWNDEKFRHLSDDAQRLFLYLMSSPHSNSIGLYVLRKMYICDDLNIDIGKIRSKLDKPLKELIDNDFIMYDEKVNLVLILNHLKHNKIENDKQAKGAAKLVPSLPKSSIYEEVIKRLNKYYHKPLTDELKKLYCPAEEKPVEVEDDQSSESEEPMNDKAAYEIFFSEFWELYPKRNGKKVGKAAAKKKFFALKPGDLANIIIAVKNYAESTTAKNGFAKDPERFLSKDYWKDWMESENQAGKSKKIWACKGIYYAVADNKEIFPECPQRFDCPKYIINLKDKDQDDLIMIKPDHPKIYNPSHDKCGFNK